jgi:hypothetical protein
MGQVWEDKGKDVWQAGADGDSLEQLAVLVAGDAKEWVCIWPLKPYDLWDKYPVARRCARANVSNLTKKSGASLAITLLSWSDSWMNWAGWADIPNVARAAQYIRDKSTHGGKPIGQLVVFGHGGCKVKSGDDEPCLDPTALESVSEVPAGTNDLEHAKKWMGPRRCWFIRTKPVVRLIGCSSSGHAADWAEKELRGGTAGGFLETTVTADDSSGLFVFSWPSFSWVQNGETITVNPKSGDIDQYATSGAQAGWRLFVGRY